jgi:hypothetical protein
MLITNKGTKTRKPQAALNPTPIQSPKIVSIWVFLIFVRYRYLVISYFKVTKKPYRVTGLSSKQWVTVWCLRLRHSYC